MDTSNISRNIGQISRRSNQNLFNNQNQRVVNDTTQQWDQDDLFSTIVSCSSKLCAELSHAYYPSLRSLFQIPQDVREQMVEYAVDNTLDLFKKVDDRLQGQGQTQQQNQTRSAS